MSTDQTNGKNDDPKKKEKEIIPKKPKLKPGQEILLD